MMQSQQPPPKRLALSSYVGIMGFLVIIVTIFRLGQMSVSNDMSVGVDDSVAYAPEGHHVNEQRNVKRKPPNQKRATVNPSVPTTGQKASRAMSGAKITTTEAGVDVSGEELYTTVDLKGDTSTATVMGLATGYLDSVFHRFVGSLRKSGFQGHIILGVAPTTSKSTLDYLAYRNVTTKVLRWVNCTYDENAADSELMAKGNQCAHPYTDIKSRWSRFPLQRDWLEECKTCTGPVLIMDVRDSWFQLNPFGPGSPAVKGLQVFEEHKNQTTQHWLTKWPIGKCKGKNYKDTMLCSGTTVGTRTAMIKYLEVMYAEMKAWIKDPKCRFGINGDDQSIHNHLFYSGQLPFATAIPNRSGGIVHTVGFEAAKIRKAKRITLRLPPKKKIEDRDLERMPFAGASGNRWLGKQYDLVDDEGYLTEFDGSRSRVIHQWDRFGTPYTTWMTNNGLHIDKIPTGIKK